MINKMCFPFLLIIANFFSVKAQNHIDSLNIELTELHQKYDLPGYGAMIITKDSILFGGGFGYADKKSKTPYTIHTLQRIGSISKTFIAIAIMQLVDNGQLTLETSINDILPFKILHPLYPNDPITIKHLVTHTSGIQDSYWDSRRSYIMEEKFTLKKRKLPKGYFKHAAFFNKNSILPMSEFLKNLLDKNGIWYDQELMFLENAPGTTYKYSNIASTLAAYIVEIITKERFDTYTTKNILRPLGMNDSGWLFDKVDMKKYATLYFHDGKEVPKYSSIAYPAGYLISSPLDMSYYLMEMMNGYEGTGKLLSKDAYQKMFTVQFEGGDNPGIFWDIGTKTINHNGGDQGLQTLISFHKEKKVGKILFTNTNAHWIEELEEQFSTIWRKMYEYQGKLIEN